MSAGMVCNPGEELETFPWHLGVYDAHCHPTDTMSSINELPDMKARALTVMSTRAQDQDLVFDAAAGDAGLTFDDVKQLDGTSSTCKFLPSFGWHPWFSHLLHDDAHFPSPLDADQKIAHYRSVIVPPPDEDFISSLPEPYSLAAFIDATRTRLQSHPLALLGEVGLDRSFKLPHKWDDAALQCRDDSLTPGGREGRRLSNCQVSLDHQKLVLIRQLKLAGEMGRAASVHGVRAPGFLFDTLAETWKGWVRKSKRQKEKEEKERTRLGGGKGSEDEEQRGPRPFPPRLCLHSYSGSAETVKMYTEPEIPVEIFFSFSMVINFEGPQAGKAEEALRRVPDDRVLVESDLHTAGKRMDQCLEQAVRKICEIKGWELEEGVRILGRNWRRFVFGDGCIL